MRAVRDDSDRVGWRDERALAIDHVSVAITVTRSTKLDIVLLHGLHKRTRICQIRVGVSSTKVGQRDTILDRGLGKTELLDENRARIGTGDTMQTVKQDAERRCIVLEEVLDKREIKDFLQQDDVIGDGVDDLHLGGSVASVANF